MITFKKLPPSAFSLIEVIAVVSIIAIVITASVPQISGILTSSRLRTAADAVYSRLLEAQSLAVLFNADTELRLYEVPDLVGDRPTLRKLRILTLRPPEDENTGAEGDAFEPVGTVTDLDNEIEISRDTKHSSIASLGFQDSSEDKLGRYISLRFRSDGSPALPPTSPWFLTIHEKDAHLHHSKLKNFVTIQIDPATGRLRTFNP